MLKGITTLIGSMALVLAFSVQGSALSEEPFADECCQVSTKTAETSGCSQCDTKLSQNGKQHGKRGGGMKGGHKGGKQGGGSQKGVMQGAQTLIINHGSLTREVIEIPGGVRTISTTTDPKMVAVLQSHPREMDKHLSDGGKVRQWDPFFAEIAKYHNKIDMKFNNLPNGIEVISTSKDPRAIELIRAHAYRVSDFVARGREAAREITPIP